jgi:hypothetical protein
MIIKTKQEKNSVSNITVYKLENFDANIALKGYINSKNSEIGG